jgi:RNA polymerase sigma factor (sigma-70 family)
MSDMVSCHIAIPRAAEKSRVHLSAFFMHDFAVGGCHSPNAMAGDSTLQSFEPDDAELLRRYVATRCEEAFATLVRRHLDLVYNVALRKVGGDTHLAEDIAQRVFAGLAAKAATLQRHPVITGWLFTCTHYAAAQLVRTERRRKAREQKAHAMNELLGESDPAIEWKQLRPLLDDLVLKLPERDREAVLLRYFEGRPFAEVGARLHLTDHGARARVDRAVEKLRAMLSRRGITSTSAALGLALTHQATAAVPAGLAVNVTGAALTASALSGVLATGVISFMSMTKITVIGATLVAISAIGLGLAQRARTKTASSEVTTSRHEQDVPAAQFAHVDEPIKKMDAPVAAPQETASVASSSVHAAVRAESVLPAQTLEATKAALATVNMAGGWKSMSLDSQHVANVRAWMDRDAANLAQWIATLPPGKQREHTTEAVIAIATETDPELAFLFTGGIDRETPRMNRRFEVVRAWAARDPAAATRVIAAADLPERERERLLSAISAIGRKQ